MYFDPDASNVTPGFRLGFPTIEPIYYDSTTEKFSYLMVTPSGARIEFQQTAASNTYETVDSSYVQLKTNGTNDPNDPYQDISITVTGTNGTQMDYEWVSGAYRCQSIKDRNGNYIDITYNGYGQLATVKDTLGRVITVNYDSAQTPSSITQQWKTNNGDGSPTTRTYATFSYVDYYVNPAFDTSLAIYGPQGQNVRVLSKIIYGTAGANNNTGETRFEYNTFGQVKKIRNFAPDGTELNYVATNLETPGTNKQDVPRLTQTRSWVKNFNLVDNQEQEVIFNNDLIKNETYNLPNHTGQATLIEVSMLNPPSGITVPISKTFVGETGWQEGLPIATETCLTTTCTGTNRKRWTWNEWTQDDTTLTHIKNPRVTESQVGDDENSFVRRSKTFYKLLPSTTIADNGLVERVEIYDTDQTTILKKVETDYNLDSNYISRRIIGLPGETRSYGYNESTSQLELVSKVTYGYDEEDFAQETNQNIAPVQHDTGNYGASFVVGRGNLTSTTRWDADFPTSASEAVTSRVRYDIAGSPVAAIDPLNRKVRTEYTDEFNDDLNRNTYAYPTKVFDPANNFSEIEYRYDFGANVWARSPAPSGNTNGKETTREYDSFGRLPKETLENTGAYTRYEYPTNQTQSKVYSTVTDTNSNGADAADEVLAESWTDGAGRVLQSRTEHPGSSGGWSGTLVEYDILGRVERSTVPTEINSSWNPAGDDAATGWLWTSQEYDWNSRVTRKINTDGTDQLISYSGCGCAGGQVTTIQSELVPRDDIPTQNARRKQKVYQDILGRTYKTEVYKWDGATVYTTTTQKFNGRDQIIETKQTDNQNSIDQYVTMTYDGHGRMKTRHYPIEDPGTNTTWTYNDDDTIQMIVDPRDAITNFVYEPVRGLLTDTTYDPPASTPPNITIPDAPDVNFEYDNLGNRTKMTDGTGTVEYFYDELSRLTSEKKYFTDLPSAPVAENKYTISYTYNLSGGLKSVTDPFNNTVTYTHDKTGRLTKVDGTPTTDNPTGQYADNIQYRAFGAIKQIDYKKPTETSQIKMDYDTRRRINHFEVTGGGGYLMNADYTYHADSRMDAKDDLEDDRFDRINRYDFAGRLVFNQFEMATNHDNEQVRLYEQNITYDAFSMMTNRSGEHWGQFIGYSASYINGRMQNQPQLVYDAAGNIAHSGTQNTPHDYGYTHFDAAGRRVKNFSSSKGRLGNQLNIIRENQTEYQYDGDGRPVREKFGYRQYPLYSNDPPPPIVIDVEKYQIWSSVLGSAFTSINPDGEKLGTQVFAGGAVIGSHGKYGGTGDEQSSWMTADPVTGKSHGYSYFRQANDNKEREPLGQEVLDYDPTDDDELSEPPPNETLEYWRDMQWQCDAGEDFYGGFYGMPQHCQMAVAQDFSRGLDQIFGWDQEENPQKLPTGVDSPLPDISIPGSGGSSPSNTALAFAMSSTSKDKKPKCGNGKKAKKDAAGKWQCVGVGEIIVDVDTSLEPTFPKDLIIYNAEFGLLGRRLNDIEVSRVVDDVQKIIDANLDCASFINGILNEGSTETNPVVSNDISDVIWATHRQGGIYVFDNLGKGGTAPGSIGNSNSTIKVTHQYRTYNNVYYRKGSAAYKWGERSHYRGQELRLASIVLNEAIHNATVFGLSDIEMATATAAYLDIPPLNLPTRRPPEGMSIKDWNGEFSSWWHSKVGGFCNYTGTLKNEGL